MRKNYNYPLYICLQLHISWIFFSVSLPQKTFQLKRCVFFVGLPAKKNCYSVKVVVSHTILFVLIPRNYQWPPRLRSIGFVENVFNVRYKKLISLFIFQKKSYKFTILRWFFFKLIHPELSFIITKMSHFTNLLFFFKYELH